MANSKKMSYYDKELKRMFKDSKLLVIDLDGTLIDFEKIDNIIISQLFPNNRFIDSIDNILWKINKLDIIGNGYFGLKVRLAVYSLFSKYSFKECKRIYGKMYEKLASIELVSRYISILDGLINSGYSIIIATKNVYAKNILNSELFSTIAFDKDKFKLIILKKDKKKQFKKIVEENNGKVCVIGNNLSDDIINSYKIGSPFIYIGKSRLMVYIIKIINFFSCKFSTKYRYKRGIELKKFDQIKNIFEK